VIGAAVEVMRIATGEEPEELDSAKSAAAELGSRGGKARAAGMTPGKHIGRVNDFTTDRDRLDGYAHQQPTGPGSGQRAR